MADDDDIKLDYGNRREKWVTVWSYSNSAQAHLARAQLERAGIPSYIDNENVGHMLWHIQPAVGGVNVRVPESALAEAKAVLESPSPIDTNDDDDPSESWRDGVDEGDGADEEDDVDPDLRYEDDDEPADLGELRYAGYASQTEEDPQGACPKCHSEDIATVSWKLRIAQCTALLLIFPLYPHPAVLAIAAALFAYFLITKPRFRCTRCGHRWTPEA